MLLHFTGPPVPITARVHSTPQDPASGIHLGGLRRTDLRVLLAVGESGESSGREWGTGPRVRKGEGERWVLSDAPLPLLAQEDP
eukprot:1179292-Prorocentrum_minimum.AAC.1